MIVVDEFVRGYGMETDIADTFKVGDFVEVIGAGQVHSTWHEFATKHNLTKYKDGHGCNSGHLINGQTGTVILVAGLHYDSPSKKVVIETDDDHHYIMSAFGLKRIHKKISLNEELFEI